MSCITTCSSGRRGRGCSVLAQSACARQEIPGGDSWFSGGGRSRECPPGLGFAPAWRGRGVYRALVADRADGLVRVHVPDVKTGRGDETPEDIRREEMEMPEAEQPPELRARESELLAQLDELHRRARPDGQLPGIHIDDERVSCRVGAEPRDVGDVERIAAEGHRCASLGGGQEYERWFWNAYASKGLSGATLNSTSSVATTVTQTGSEAGRPYEQDTITTVTTRSFTRAYDWGVGGRVGHFYEAALLRVTAGLDYEWGKYSSKQWTGTLMAEKFFAGSPISIALSGEILRKTGDFEGTRNDQRGMLMLRYEFGAPKSNFRSNKVSRMVTTTERVPDPNWKPPVVAAARAVSVSGLSVYESMSHNPTSVNPPERTLIVR